MSSFFDEEEGSHNGKKTTAKLDETKAAVKAAEAKVAAKVEETKTAAKEATAKVVAKSRRRRTQPKRQR